MLLSRMNQNGAVPLIGLVAVVGIVAFLGIAYIAPLKDSLFSNLYSKSSSEAAQPKTEAEEGRPLDVVQDHILVKFKENSGQARRAQVLAEHNLKQKDEISQIGVKIMSIPESKVPEEVVDAVRSKFADTIEFAEVDGIASAVYTPNDPGYSSMWQHKNIQTDLAWDSVNGTGITVAVSDTGIEPTHPDLAANLVPGWNIYNNNSDTSDFQGHGTAVAGAAAAIGDNGNQIAGVAFNAKIMPIRIAYLGSDGKAYASFSNMAKSIIYAADHGAKLVNISYGATGWCADQDSTMKSAADYMYKKGGLTFFAAGNNATDPNCSNNPQIIQSSATDVNDNPASFTTFGNHIDVGSPGVSVWVTRMGGGIGTGSGTSFASPITMGVAALVWQVNPNLTPGQVTDILTASADDKGAAGYDKYFGWGRLNAQKAVSMALLTTGPSPSPSATSSPVATPSLTPTPTPTPDPSPTPPPGGDTTPPVVSIISPLNGATVPVKKTTVISAAASDDVAVSKVEILVNNSLKCTDTAAPFTCSWKVNPKAANYVITAKAYDAAGNNSSASVSVSSK